MQLGKYGNSRVYTKKVLIGEKIRYFADEYDLLYTYLQGGFNNFDNLYYKQEEKEVLFVPYKEGIITKKLLKREKNFQLIIDYVRKNKESSWLEKVICLLAVPPIVQKQNF